MEAVEEGMQEAGQGEEVVVEVDGWDLGEMTYLDGLTWIFSMKRSNCRLLLSRTLESLCAICMEMIMCSFHTEELYLPVSQLLLCICLLLD